jgi:hypothetical protein
MVNQNLLTPALGTLASEGCPAAIIIIHVSQCQTAKRGKGGDWNPRPIQVRRAVGREVCFLVFASTHIGRPVRDDDIAIRFHYFSRVGSVVRIEI